MSITGIWGEDKSCKSTLAMSYPKPLVVMEFDIGGFERACRNHPHLPIKQWVEAGLIIYEEYALPLQGVKMDSAGNVTFLPSKAINGIKELFYKWLSQYFKHLQDPNIKTIVVDTGTLLYNTVICDGYLQELQEKQLADPTNRGALRSQLQQQEYREPYDRMRGITYQAKRSKKNLVLTHHAADEFKPMLQKDGSIAKSATGKRERHGWRDLGDSVDYMIHTYIVNEPIMVDGKNSGQTKAVPYGKIEIAEVLELAGMEFREPTYEKIIQIANMIKG